MILENRGGMLFIPMALTYTPPHFQDDHGQPLIALSDIGWHDLSTEYHFEDLDRLTALGVMSVSDEKFLINLDLFLQKNSNVFRSRESAWHIRLAEVLLPLAQQKYIVILRGLELIPLSNHRWASAKSEKIFFNTVRGDWPVPDGLGIAIVDEQAAASSTRHTLFTLLGVMQIDTPLLWDMITKEHGKPLFNESSISHAALLSQVSFLFLSGWENRQNQTLWLESEAEDRVQGNRLYRDSEKAYSSTHFFGMHRRRFKFVHPDFTASFPDRSEEWLTWLCVNVGLEAIPRMIFKSSKTSFTIHPDMEHMIESLDSLDVLLFLREYWDLLAPWIVFHDNEDSLSEIEHSRRQIRERIGRMKVKCVGGLVKELNHTAFNANQPPSETLGIQPILDIPESNDPRWGFLRNFGVGHKRNLRTYMNCLEDLSGTDVSLDRVSYLLKLIERSCSEDEISVRYVICRL
jgi:hypothetical protein